MKKIFCAILVFFLPISVYAYVVSSDVTIDNQTDKNLVITFPQLYNQPPITKEIAAKHSETVSLDNGDHSGLLYQASVFPFNIKDVATGIEQVNGRMAFYVGASVWNKYSFPDSVQSSPSIQVKQSYSCDSGGSPGKFDNKFVITGNPDELAAPVQSNKAYIHCITKLESSIKPNDYNYTGACTGNKQVNYFYDSSEVFTFSHGWHCHWRLDGGHPNGFDSYPDVIPVTCNQPQAMTKEKLDKMVQDYKLCYDWLMDL